VVETTRRQEIEDVASSLFHEHGYSGTSVRDIARALDIQGASLYAHVASKQDVLWSIVDGTASRFEAAADAVTPAPDAESAPDPADRLAALVRAHVGIVTDDVERASVFIHEWRSLSSERRAEIAHRRDAYEQRFREVIADGVGAYLFAPVDPVAAAAYLLTALNGLVAWYRPDRRLTPAALADAYVQLSLQALDAGRNAEVPA
jgi:TetR/AcrR family transcriptional regulator, cholesterol catabolism regulator